MRPAGRRCPAAVAIRHFTRSLLPFGGHPSRVCQMPGRYPIRQEFIPAFRCVRRLRIFAAPDRADGCTSFESMCGRYTLTNPDPARLRARFDILESVEVADEPRFNIAPTDPVLAVRRLDDRRGARPAALGPGARLLGRARRAQRPLINARAETIADAAGVRRVVSRAPLPDPGRRLLRVAHRRAAASARSGSAVPTRTCSRSRASGRSSSGRGRRASCTAARSSPARRTR